MQCAVQLTVSRLPVSSFIIKIVTIGTPKYITQVDHVITAFQERVLLHAEQQQLVLLIPPPPSLSPSSHSLSFWRNSPTRA